MRSCTAERLATQEAERKAARQSGKQHGRAESSAAERKTATERKTARPARDKSRERRDRRATERKAGAIAHGSNHRRRTTAVKTCQDLPTSLRLFRPPPVDLDAEGRRQVVVSVANARRAPEAEGRQVVVSVANASLPESKSVGRMPARNQYTCKIANQGEQPYDPMLCSTQASQPTLSSSACIHLAVSKYISSFYPFGSFYPFDLLSFWVPFTPMTGEPADTLWLL